MWFYKGNLYKVFDLNGNCLNTIFIGNCFCSLYSCLIHFSRLRSKTLDASFILVDLHNNGSLNSYISNEQFRWSATLTRLMFIDFMVRWKKTWKGYFTLKEFWRLLTFADHNTVRKTRPGTERVKGLIFLLLIEFTFSQ